MKRYKYNRFMLAMIFMLLNCVCMASGAIKVNAPSKTAIVSLEFEHDANDIDTESNSLSTYSFKNNQLSFSSDKYVTKQFLKDVNAPQRFVLNIFLPSLASYLIPEPGYYSFLFQFSLF